MHLSTRGVVVCAGDRRLLDEVGIEVASGEVVGLVGPNGSGKSTLLRCIYRAIRPEAGWLTLGDDDLLRLPVRKLAQQMAVLPQDTANDHGFTVMEVVLMGRHAHQSLLARETAGEHDLALDTLRRVGLDGYEQRSFATLSGGERQRALLARAIVQQPSLLVLDEPTNHLDVRHQIEIMDVVKRLGVTVLVTLHDLNLAAAYCDRLVVLLSGAVVASGPPREILTPALVHEVFGVHADLVRHPTTGITQLLYS